MTVQLDKCLIAAGLCTLLFAPLARSAPSECTIIYALNGMSYQTFNEQIELLAPHLRGKKIQLIDLNKWQSLPPHLEVSGREKAKLRKQYALNVNADNAVLLDRKGMLVQRYQNSVDLVDIMLNCDYGNEGQDPIQSALAKQADSEK